MIDKKRWWVAEREFLLYKHIECHYCLYYVVGGYKIYSTTSENDSINIFLKKQT
jgi:hypothetical protein